MPYPKLIFTVALKAELPQEFLREKQILFFTLNQFLQNPELKATINSTFFILITGVGEENSRKSITWILENFKPLYIVNVGTAGTNDKSVSLLSRIDLGVEGGLPPSKSFFCILGGLCPPSIQKKNFIDMEYQTQSELLKNTGISFQTIKFITDYNDENLRQDFKKNLPLVREKIKSVFDFVKIRDKEPKISVIVPTYNRAKTIKSCLDSILNQTLKLHEIIVADDGSTDETKTILDQIPGLKVIRIEKNGGVSYARNLAIKQAKGDWLAFCDSDDTWTKDKLQKQWLFLQQNPFYEIMQSQDIWIRNGVRVNPQKHLLKKEGWIFSLALERCLVSASNVLLKKELFDKFGYFDEKLPACEDYDLWLRILRHKPIGLDQNYTMYRYEGHEDQLSHKYEAMDRFRIYSLEKLLINEQEPEIKVMIKNVLEQKQKIYINGVKKRNLGQ